MPDVHKKKKTKLLLTCSDNKSQIRKGFQRLFSHFNQRINNWWNQFLIWPHFQHFLPKTPPLYGIAFYVAKKLCLCSFHVWKKDFFFQFVVRDWLISLHIKITLCCLLHMNAERKEWIVHIKRAKGNCLLVNFTIHFY